jgi:Tfp pilus assembly protein PilN
MNKQKGFVLGIQMYVYIAIAVAVLAGVGYLKYQFSHLQSENAILTQNNATLKDNLSKAEQVNKEADVTIKQLQQDRTDADKALNDLRIQKQRDNKELSSLRDFISVQRKDPTQDGQVSPILKSTIRSIQNSRKGATK